MTADTGGLYEPRILAHCFFSDYGSSESGNDYPLLEAQDEKIFGGKCHNEQTKPKKASRRSLPLPCCSLPLFVQLLLPWLLRRCWGRECLEAGGGFCWGMETSSPGVGHGNWVAPACVHGQGTPNESAPTTHPFLNVGLNVLLWFLGLRHLLMA